MKYLLENLKDYKKECILAPLFKMLEALFDLFVPLVVADIINRGIANGDQSYIIRHCLLLILLAVIGLSCSFTAQFFAAKASVHTAARLRYALFAHIQTLDYSKLDTIGVSTLITRMSSDINLVQNGINWFLRLFLRSPFIVFGAVIMAFVVNAKMALIFAVAVPVLAVIVFGILIITSPMYRKNQKQLDGVLGLVRENLTGVRVVRSFGREEQETAAFEEKNSLLCRLQQKVGRVSGLMNPMTYVVVNLGIIAIIYLGSRMVNHGILLSGDIVALINYMNQILVELVKMANTIILLSKAMASLGRIESIMDTQSSMVFPEKSEFPADQETEEAVRFDHVSLTYEGAGEENLTDITFTAKKGQTIGIIGGTGSGKSSLVSLIPRYYDASKGNIEIFGHPISSYSKSDLRKSIACVMQKTQLFTGTVRSNLLWGKADASDEELWEALRLAQAEEFVRQKPGGLEEEVEQGGRNLSGGQRQRLSIARALVRKPQILILDDSSSALDFATDAALRKALRELKQKTTVFIVSQRTSSIAHADQILVLDDGLLAGVGDHQSLLKSCSVYREIYESQFKEGGEQ